MAHTLAWLAIVAGVALLTAALTRIVSRPRELSLSEIQELKRVVSQADTPAQDQAPRLLSAP